MLCRLLQVSSSGFYDWDRRRTPAGFLSPWGSGSVPADRADSPRECRPQGLMEPPPGMGPTGHPAQVLPIPLQGLIDSLATALEGSWESRSDPIEAFPTSTAPEVETTRALVPLRTKDPALTGWEVRLNLTCLAPLVNPWGNG
jgi:hypothetical protein